MFEVHGLTKRYGATHALTDVSLTFPEGHITMLLGENGAGKSTMMSLLAGLTSASSGAIHCDGQPLVIRSARDSRAAGIAIIPQQPVIVEGLSVAENVFLGQLPNRHHAFRRKAAEDALEQLVESTRIGERLLSIGSAASLSPADRQIVEILRAIARRPALIGFDEPTAALGEEDVHRLRGVVGELREAGTAIIYVTHRRAEVEELGTRTAVLRDGRLVGIHEDGVDFVELLREMAGRQDVGSGLATRRRSGAALTASSATSTLLAAHRLTNDKLKAVSLDVAAGEIVGIAGLAASGRSSLARALAGAAPLEEGVVSIDGQALPQSERANPRRSRIAYIPEDRHIDGVILCRSIRENIALSSYRDLRRLRWINRRAENALADRMIAELAIRCHSRDSLVSSLSGGNQQKVVLARGLAAAPLVWILDEPTKGIDIATKEAFYALMDRFAAEGAAIILISSEMPELLSLSDRVMVMRDGAIVAECHGDQMTAELVVSAMFGEGLTQEETSHRGVD